MHSRILVTGALGNVGAEVVALLRQGNQPVRATHRNAKAIHQRFGNDIDAAALDFRRPETFASAFAGIERVLLVRPPAIADVRRFIFPVVDAAARAGVQQIVFLSLLGAERNPFVPHHKIEHYLRASGIAWTFLRPSFFMQNLNTTHRAEIRDRDEIFVPAGNGKTSFIDVRDIAAVAALALTEHHHMNRAYALTGSQALSYDEVAERYTHILGRRISYRNPSLLRFVRRQRQQGTPWLFVLVMAGIYTTARLGLAGRITLDTQQLLGRAPLTMEHYIRDYQACWQPGTA